MAIAYSILENVFHLALTLKRHFLKQILKIWYKKSLAYIICRVNRYKLWFTKIMQKNYRITYI